MAISTSILSTAFQIFDSLPSTIHVLIGIAITFLFLIWFLKKEIRLFCNIRRPIMIFCSGKGTMNMGMETNILRDSKLFKIPEDPTNSYQDCNRIKNHSLVIIGYTPKMDGFKDILDAIKVKKIPVIVYTKEQIDPDDRKLLDSYPWHSVCNFPLKLMNDVFTILSTFPNEKR